MAKRSRYVNPFSKGLLGGVAEWAKSMEKYNLLAAQNEARQKAYQVKYGAMADVAKLRAQNNAMIAKLKAELPQKQYTQTITGADGKPIIVKGHMVPDPQNPDQFIPHEDVRMTPEQYAATLGKGVTSSGYTLSPGQKRLDAQGNVIAENPRGRDPQEAIAARQAAREKELNARQDKAEQRRINAEAARSTNAAMRDFDKATPDEQAALAKSMGLSPEVPDPNAKTFFGNPKEGATKPNEQLRKQYRDAVHKQALEESMGTPAGEAPVEGGDTTGATSLPPNKVPTIWHGADGKAYQLPDGLDEQGKPKVDPSTGKVHAIPLAMDTVDAGDAVAQAGGEESGETTPDSESAEGEQDPYEGLLNQFASASDSGLAQTQDQMASDQELEPSPEDEQSGLLTG